MLVIDLLEFEGSTTPQPLDFRLFTHTQTPTHKDTHIKYSIDVLFHSLLNFFHFPLPAFALVVSVCLPRSLFPVSLCPHLSLSCTGIHKTG